ncbi:transcriptional regulator [Sulfitobacter alexandrii]|uniref:Transcriptional regulator n=1 Tax=Sulfitobacter alexandrii TaxID=1917485 RepID=A0A1J0WH95_9RHOB|nr:helix-turn-helix transcriptional regulator [Sulfitobacter alexandrii]APE43674.1 transcriptional regulator [Sulfitobacter alexandrii]
MKPEKQSPAQLRNMFGENLRKLAQEYRSISELSRQLGINRTQFNRYLSGESFPRPDILARMCEFFRVDARVLLQPVEEITRQDELLTTPYLRDFIGAGALDVPDSMFPSGFYRFSRRSFVEPERFVVSLVLASREGPRTRVRGFETAQAMELQNLPRDGRSREFRGAVMRQDDGISILAARRNAMTTSFNYLARVPSFEQNFWVGYATRTVPEAAGGLRVTRLVYEYLGPAVSDALSVARDTGFTTFDALQPYHKRLLRAGIPFS